MGFTPPNSLYGGSNNRGSSAAPMGGIPQAGRGAMPTGDRFRVADAKMPQPPSAIEPGKGAIPIYPWNQAGLPQTSAPLPDDAPVPKMPPR